MQAIQEKTEQLPLLTNSSRGTFNDCRRKYLLKYVWGYEPVKINDTMYFGSLYHGALECFYNGDVNLAIQWLNEQSIEWNQYHVSECKAMIIAYSAFWEDANDKLAVQEVECEFRAPLLNPKTGRKSRTFELGGKLDAIVADIETGEKFIMEHKTTSLDISPDADYWKQLRLDGQISGYYVGAEQLEYDVVGCIYDVVKRTGKKPLKATPVENRKYRKADGQLYAGQREFDETPAEYEERVLSAILEDPERYFVREKIYRTDDQLIEYLADMWGFASEIRMADHNRAWPRNPKACIRFGTCPFFDVCTGSISLEDESYFCKKIRIHMELQEVN